MLFICGQSFISGGEYALKTLIQNLVQIDNNIYLICSNNIEIKKFFEMPSLVIIECPYFQSLTSLKRKYRSVGHLIKIFNMALFFLFFIKTILKIKPKIIVSNNFSEIPASIFAFLFKIPFVQYVHEIIQKDSKNYIILKFFKKIISRFIFVSNASKNSVHLILPESKIAVIYNSIDLPKQIKPKEISLQPLKLLFIGMINKNKNPLRYLNWIRILNSEYQISAKIIYHLWEDDLLDECKRFAQIHLLNIEWIQNADQKTITYHIADSHFLCSTSHYEAQPLTVLNAIALGTPIITTQNKGVPEIICDASAGIVINSDSDLNEKVQLYIQSNNYRKMSRNCLLESTKYSHKNRVTQFLKIANSL